MSNYVSNTELSLGTLKLKCIFFNPVGTKGQTYPFGIMGMANKADCLQKGELVKFQVCTVAQTGQKMACGVVPQRRAMVECVKDQVAFTFIT